MQKVTIELDKLKLFIDKFISENGRLPMMKEFSRANGSPYGRGLIEKQLSGIQNICKLLGYDFVKKAKEGTNVDDDLVKKFIDDFVSKNGKLPIANDFNTKNKSPYCRSIIIGHYKSLKNCFDKLGYNTDGVRVSKCIVEDDVMLNFINSYREKNGVNPGLNDFKRRLGCPYNKSSILDKYKSIEEMYNFFNLKSKPLTMADAYSDEELLSNLLKAIYKHRTTDRDELRKLSPETIFDRSAYERRFNSWSEALIKAGFTDYNRILFAKFLDYKGENPTEYLKEKIGKDGDFTEKQKYYIKNKTNNKCVQRKHFKSTNFYNILVGNRICKVGNLIVKQIAKDGHICDSNSEKIVDNFLYDNGFKHETHVKYPDSKRICDFKIGDIYIEYAGYYNTSEEYNKRIDEKIQYAKNNNLKLYILYNHSQSSLDDMKQFIINVK